MSRTIVCYGDSNTWGYTPGSGARFDEKTRWTGRLQLLLGEEYRIVECGMNARTTSFDDPFRDYLNGRHGLVHGMVAAKPVDLLIISLGTNDLKYGTVYRSAKGLDALLDVAVHANIYMPGSSPVYRDEPRILVLSRCTKRSIKNFPAMRCTGSWMIPGSLRKSIGRSAGSGRCISSTRRRRRTRPRSIASTWMPRPTRRLQIPFVMQFRKS